MKSEVCFQAFRLRSSILFGIIISIVSGCTKQFQWLESTTPVSYGFRASPVLRTNLHLSKLQNFKPRGLRNLSIPRADSSTVRLRGGEDAARRDVLYSSNLETEDLSDRELIGMFQHLMSVRESPSGFSFFKFRLPIDAVPAGVAKVAVVGSWNKWVTPIQMRPNLDGQAWEADLPLPPGSYSFKFLVGSTWMVCSDYPKDDGIGGEGNNVINLTAWPTEAGSTDGGATITSAEVATAVARERLAQIIMKLYRLAVARGLLPPPIEKRQLSASPPPPAVADDEPAASPSAAPAAELSLRGGDGELPAGSPQETAVLMADQVGIEQGGLVSANPSSSDVGEPVPAAADVANTVPTPDQAPPPPAQVDTPPPEGQRQPSPSPADAEMSAPPPAVYQSEPRVQTERPAESVLQEIELVPPPPTVLPADTPPSAGRPASPPPPPKAPTPPPREPSPPRQITPLPLPVARPPSPPPTEVVPQTASPSLHPPPPPQSEVLSPPKEIEQPPAPKEIEHPPAPPDQAEHHPDTPTLECQTSPPPPQVEQQLPPAPLSAPPAAPVVIDAKDGANVKVDLVDQAPTLRKPDPPAGRAATSEQVGSWACGLGPLIRSLFGPRPAAARA
mmetsp:Transcript_39863/g.106423  ORF Transcript_39863/g.106423 Transcript_39863/m.106423 type:complete len:617 (+) Transcript_39863:50-1900(+)